MTTNREKMLDKIRALLSKTVDNGCSEAEALAALDKARALMDAYEVTEEDLKLEAEVVEILRSEPHDPHNIKASLAVAISEFCDCRVWKGAKGITFCGMRSDAELARWMLDALAGFVQAELANHLIGCVASRGERRLMINGFVGGCTRRISERLRILIKQSKVVASSNSRALVVAKAGMIAAAMKAANINLGNARRSRRRIDDESYKAGIHAGDRASFGRPVSGPAGTNRIGKAGG